MSFFTRHYRPVVLCAVGAVLVIAALAAFAVARWPFREAQMTQRIADATGAQVQLGAYRQYFFPHPGCVIEKMTLTHPDPAHPKITVERVQVDGLYGGLIGSEKHIRRILFGGLKIYFPPRPHSQQTAGKPLQNATTPSGIKFDQVEALNSQVVFLQTSEDKEPRTFDIYDLVLKSFSPGKAIHFDAVLRIPSPNGDVHVAGLFGPLTGDELGKARLQGSFTLKNADLSTFKALTGELSGQGEFDGTLDNLNIKGSTDSPNFGARETKHSLPLRTQFNALVDGTSGDVNIRSVNAKLGKTPLSVEGKLVASDGDHKKMLTLKVHSDDARVEDLIYLFIHSKPPIQGATQFEMNVRLPPGDRPFAERVAVTGEFGIRGSHFTKSETQEKVGELSEKAQGNPKDDNPTPVLTELRGEVKLANATAHFSRLTVAVPGANAAMQGTFNIETEVVDMHGTLHTEVKLSKATTGLKSFLMKVVESVKAEKRRDATVPVHVAGTYDKPEFGVDAAAAK